MPISFRERLEGLLLAGALGDCIGSSVEGVGASQLPSPLRWSWTDDTQLTVATCEAIVAAGAVSPETVASAMLGYYRRGILRGLGSTTLGALQALGAGAHWALSGLGGEYSAGNGAAMRVAPLGFFIDPTNYLERRVFRDVVRITHKNDEAYAAALAVVISVAEAIEPSGKGVVELLPDSRTRDAIERFHPSWTIAQAAAALGTGGYAAESVPLALYAVSCAGRDGFVPVLEQLVQVGGDVDTIASIYGQVYGAAHGSGSLPIELIVDLPGREELTLVAHQLSTLLGPG